MKLKKEQKSIRKQKLEEKQTNEASALENDSNEEIRNFDKDWDERIENYKFHCRDSEEQLKQRHFVEFESAKKLLEENTPVIPKHSSEILNCKRIQDTLIKNKEYKQAHIIQQKIIELEEKEKLSWKDERATKIQQSLTALVKKHEGELNRLIQRAKNGFGELKKQRATELESLIKKYQNLKKKMKIAHKMEKNRFNGLLTAGGFRNDTSTSFLSQKIKNSENQDLIHENSEVEVS